MKKYQITVVLKYQPGLKRTAFHEIYESNNADDPRQQLKHIANTGFIYTDEHNVVSYYSPRSIYRVSAVEVDNDTPV